MPDLPTRVFRQVAGLAARPQPPLIRLRHPVMLMHGFGALGGVGRKGMLHAEALYLRLRGVLAYAPNVASYETIECRAAMWRDHLVAVMEETGHDRVHLVAHSMGGLDARHLISTLGYHRYVETLTTVATPHHGASIAEAMLETPALLRLPALGLADWTGAAALEGVSSNVQAALHQLTRRSIVETFNPATPDHPDVTYRSWAGRAGADTPVALSPLLRLAHAAIYAREGVNDGVVGTDSAVWSGFQGVVDADHARQIGLAAGLPRRFHASAFFASLVQTLADAGG